MLRSAPPERSPEPLMVTGRLMSTPPINSSAAPAAMVVPLVAPKADELETLTVPVLMVNAPVKSLTPDKVMTPLPFLVTEPPPEILPA